MCGTGFLRLANSGHEKDVVGESPRGHAVQQREGGAAHDYESNDGSQGASLPRLLLTIPRAGRRDYASLGPLPISIFPLKYIRSRSPEVFTKASTPIRSIVQRLKTFMLCGRTSALSEEGHNREQG